MIELLLQADRAIAAGQLDQAERMYWQSIERDPQNAMAVAGLARIALERGDDETAHAFASNALMLDPDNVSASRIAASLETRGVRPAPGAPQDLTLLAAERLEALGRRRAREESPTPPAPTGAGGSQGVDARPPEIAAEAAAKAEPAAPETESAPAAPETGPEAVPESAPEAMPETAPAEHAKAEHATAVEPPTADSPSDGPPAVEPPTPEPAAPEPPTIDSLESPLSAADFAAAEAAAAIEAIDALDDAVDLRPVHFRLPAHPIRQAPVRDVVVPQASWTEPAPAGGEPSGSAAPDVAPDVASAEGGETAEEQAEAEALAEAMAFADEAGAARGITAAPADPAIAAVPETEAEPVAQAGKAAEALARGEVAAEPDAGPEAAADAPRADIEPATVEPEPSAPEPPTASGREPQSPTAGQPGPAFAWEPEEEAPGPTAPAAHGPGGAADAAKPPRATPAGRGTPQRRKPGLLRRLLGGE